MDVDATFRQRIRMAGRIRRWRGREVLHRQGSVPAGVDLILAGYVAAQVISVDGDVADADVFGPGEFVGLESAIDGLPAPTQIVPVGKVETVTINRKELLGILNPNPDTLALLRTLTRRLRREYGRLDRDNMVRIAWVTADLADRFGRKGPDGIRIQVPISQEVLASLAGTSRESVARALRTLRVRGFIGTGRRSIVVRDPAGLAALIDAR
jgi:CRP-like cAMP-binding protein